MTLAEVLQAASNTVAGNVAGPVDLITLGLRKAGVPVPENALGSSQWMREKGLLRDVEQGPARIAGETFGLLAPTVMAAKAPQIAGGMLKAGENLAAPATMNAGMAYGQRGIFMGDLSKTWDSAAVAKAEAMEKAGKDARTIWKETGTFRGVDGKWRQEIDDSAAQVNLDALSPYGDELRKFVKHNKLTKSYPDIKNGVLIKQSDEVGQLGYFSPGSFIDSIGVNAKAATNDARSILLHELQHAIQHREGFAKGGNATAEAIKTTQKMVDDLVNAGYPLREAIEKVNASKVNGLDTYRRLAGEAEARAVQSRMNLSAQQRRALFPFDSYDTPTELLTVR